MPFTMIQRVLVPTHPDRADGLGFLFLSMMPFVPHLAVAWRAGLPHDDVAGGTVEGAAAGGILSEGSLMARLEMSDAEMRHEGGLVGGQGGVA